MPSDLISALEKAYHNRDEESYERLFTALRREGFSSKEPFEEALKRVQDILSCSRTPQQYLEAISEVFGEYMGTAASRSRLNGFLREVEEEYRVIWEVPFPSDYDGLWIHTVPLVRMIPEVSDFEEIEGLGSPCPGYRDFWGNCLSRAREFFGKEVSFIMDPYSWGSFLTFGWGMYELAFPGDIVATGDMAYFYFPGMDFKLTVGVGKVPSGFLYLVPTEEDPNPERVLRVEYLLEKPLYEYERLERAYQRIVRVKKDIFVDRDSQRPIEVNEGTLLEGMVGIEHPFSRSAFFRKEDFDPVYEEEDYLFSVVSSEFLLTNAGFFEFSTPPPGKMQPYVNYVYGY